MTDNFLPEFHPVVTHGTGDTIQCLVRDKAVRTTPEERVRQRVLHWLIHDKGWRKEDLRLEKSYAWVSDPARTHTARRGARARNAEIAARWRSIEVPPSAAP